MKKLALLFLLAAAAAFAAPSDIATAPAKPAIEVKAPAPLIFVVPTPRLLAQDDVHGPTMPPPQHCDPCAQCAYWQAVACYWGAGPSCYDNSCNEIMQGTKPVTVPVPKRTIPRKAQATSLFTPLASLVPATYTPVK